VKSHPFGSSPAGLDRPSAAAGTGDDHMLYTPGEAAQRLRVRESWLRRKAAARQVPCTFLGRHLRFSPADLAAIVAAGAQPMGDSRRRRRGSRRTVPRPATGDLPRPAGPRVHASRPDDHTSNGSSTWHG
jgi:excisionase family DNA binding protein